MILLPLPKHMEEKEGNLLLGMDAMIVLDASCPFEARLCGEQLQKEIAVWAGLELELVRGGFQEGDILLKVDSALKGPQYRLEIRRDGAFVTGGSLEGLRYGVQTLRQAVRQCGGLLPCLAIEDEPDIANRGFYHDATRGRVQTLDNMKKLADTMAFYKMNQLQLYVEHSYLFRDKTELWRDDTPMTAEETMELDQYCYERGIELIPSLASFGHLYKLLGTRSYEELCELPDSAGKPFSFWARMDHHTVNVSNPDVMPVIKGMLEEYMQLFRTDKFNICADETFDLGKGRSRQLAEEKGADNLYVDYITELFDFLIEKGKTPMFWGDIISKYPELYSRIPKQVVCLSWGYMAEQGDHEIRTLQKVGATQYTCPGVSGWNTWINMMKNCYLNITRMCGYARTYGAVGVLNTDWGDFGHVNQPVFSIPGLIYGAVGSWGENVPEFQELNRQISVLEFGDPSGELVDVLAKLSVQTAFDWCHVVKVKEGGDRGLSRENILKIFEEQNMEKAAPCNERIGELEIRLREISRGMDSGSRHIVECTQVALDIMRLWNKVGIYLNAKKRGEQPENGRELAAGLERALYHYKKLWRGNSKEADLARISDIFCWYADLLRKE